MNIITPTSLTPGQKVQVLDPKEALTECLEFTVVKVTEHAVELLSPNQEKTWANLDDLYIEPSQRDQQIEP